MSLIVAIDHIQLAIPPGGEDRARAFYGAALDLTEVPKAAARKHTGGVWFESGSLKVRLGVEEAFRPARKAHPAFVADNLMTLYTRLADLGYEVTAPETVDTAMRFYAFDPFGNRLEFVEPTAAAMALAPEDEKPEAEDNKAEAGGA